MRVAVIANTEVVSYTGAGYVVRNFIRSLRANGHQVDVFEPSRYELAKWMRPRANFLRVSLGMAQCVSRLDLARYDIIEFWGAECWRALRTLRRRDSGDLLILHHSNGPEPKYGAQRYSPKYNIKDRLFVAHARESFANVDGVITVSKGDRDWLIGEGLQEPAGVVALEPGLADQFLGIQYKSRDSRTIGFCGNWLPRKGTKAIVEELSPILRAYPSWRLELVGVGTAFEKRQVFPVDVQAQIEVVPFVADKAELVRRYTNWEIFVWPSEPESFGLALAEAMACGCACVATQVGYSLQLADGTDVLHIGPGRGSLGDRVRELMRSEEARVSLGQGAARRVAELRWEHTAIRYENVLRAWKTALR